MQSIEIANLFVQRHGNDLYLTNLKLNKLVYYAQAECLRNTGKSLFTDEIEAWDYGPVEPMVYYAFSSHGSGRILEPYSPFPSLQPKIAGDETTREIVDKVAKQYGSFSAFDLVNFSHRNGSAWKLAYSGEHGVKITEQMIVDSSDGIVKPCESRKIARGIKTAEKNFPNAFRLLKDS
ncbi:Panacea domain-containing protein [Bifidobacterium aquikefiricola]|uniref:DUF4065 domain-containing protein n=1 Tax=Bifidobacterium aquikefiricola TaxID=3059038 RepID=A0AB39U8A9_9BIFI